MPHVPQAVSRFYTLDWQYALAISRLPVLRSAAVLVSVAPILTNVLSAWLPTGFWLTWVAAVLFLAAVVVLQVYCPRIIRDYRDYGAYESCGHSHRWVLWTLYYSLPSLPDSPAVISELESKGLTIPLSNTSPSVQSALNAQAAVARTTLATNRALTPANLDRDLHMLVVVHGQLSVVSVRENDPLLRQKERELFWIPFSHAAKSRPRARASFWILISAASGFVLANAVLNVCRVLLR